MGKWPHVAIVVLDFNGKADTLECVRSLARLTYPSWRLYAVDNGSREPIAAEVRSILPDAVVIENGRNLGFTGGNNVGCRRAIEDGADHILLLNNDTVVDPGCIEPLVREMEDPGVGMSTPKIYFYGEDRVFWAHGASVERWTGRSPHVGVYQKDRGQFDHVREVERITGCAMFVRREVFDRVGFLDDRFFIYSEELDWCLRARRAGYRLVVVKDSVIWHKGHRDSGRAGRPFLLYLQTRNHLLMLRKNSNHFRCGGGPALVYAGVAGMREMLRWGLRWIGSRERNDLRCLVAVGRGWADFACGRFGPPREIRS
ncbi:MAG: glycosyltransferase family 2 protein [Planctomycetes bacterium]|nr:glycosyltransferase family 2 protein [Planctomycetota bacterium]